MHFVTYLSHRNNPVLTSLNSLYCVQQPNSKNLKFKEMCLYFWSNDEDKDFINSIKLTSDGSGVYCNSSILYPWIGKFFIPWESLEITGSFRGLFFQKYQIYKLANSNSYIAIHSGLTKTKAGK
jgi:hypothetical protein